MKKQNLKNQEQNKEISRSIALAIIFILLVICMAFSLSYAWYSVSVNNTANVSTVIDIPKCASVTFNSGSTLNLNGDTSAPVSDMKALGSDKYRYSFTVKNSCSEVNNLNVALAFDETSTMPITALKYALVKQGDVMPTSGTLLSSLTPITFSDQVKQEVYTQNSIVITSGYELLNTTIEASSTDNYYLYVWVDYNEGGLENGVTLGKNFSARLVVSDFASKS